MAGFPQITAQQPVELQGDFADPTDPCTQCEQGYAEVNQAWQELTTICNSCQTQKNIQQQVTGSCSQCQTAQQTIQKTQEQIQQMGGCAQCGQQGMQFNELGQQQMTTQPQQGLVISQLGQPMPQQGMLTNQFGQQQPQQGMIINLLGESMQPQGGVFTQIDQFNRPSQFIQQVRQPMLTEMITQPQTQTQQGMITGMITQPMVQTMQPMITQPAPMPMQPVVIPPPPQPMPAPVMQPVMQPTPIPTPMPAPVQQPAPVPQYTPAQVAGIQKFTANLPGQGTFTPNIGVLPGGSFVGVGGGKTPADFGIQYGPEGFQFAKGPPGFGSPAGTNVPGAGGFTGVGPGTFCPLLPGGRWLDNVYDYQFESGKY